MASVEVSLYTMDFGVREPKMFLVNKVTGIDWADLITDVATDIWFSVFPEHWGEKMRASIYGHNEYRVFYFPLQTDWREMEGIYHALGSLPSEASAYLSNQFSYFQGGEADCFAFILLQVFQPFKDIV